MSAGGTERLLQLAEKLKSTAPKIRSFYCHKTAAALMEEAAEALELLAPLDPDIDVEQGHN